MLAFIEIERSKSKDRDRKIEIESGKKAEAKKAEAKKLKKGPKICQIMPKLGSQALNKITLRP